MNEATKLMLDRMAELRMSQSTLGALVGELEGREPHAQSGAWWWVHHPERLKPARVRTLEWVLELEPGTLIEVLGGPPRDAVKAGRDIAGSP